MSTGPRQQAFRAQLDALALHGRARSLQPRAGVDFASNDYLGLAGSERMAAAVQRALGAGVPVGAAGSRLLRGNCESHEALEAEAAAHFGAEAALMFAGGYPANVALLGTLPQTGDLLLLDALSHASSSEGARLSRAHVARFRHNDPDHAREVIAAWRRDGGRGAVWLAVESLYSMDGDQAPLDAFGRLADAEGWLVVDEAHATGVFGPDGRGLAAGLEGRGNVITLHTLGKALGCSGALVCGPAVIRDFLINRARPFVFATAASPLMAEAAREALRMSVDEPWRREELFARIDLFARETASLGLQTPGSQIVPLILGEDAATMKLAAGLQARGFDVRGIRPPTVPEGTARLRVSLTLNATENDVVALAAALEAMWPRAL